MNNVVRWDEIKTDVLVIGGGGAALRAALAAHETGAQTLIASKGKTGKSGATYCGIAEVGAFNVPDGRFDPDDSPEIFYQDIMDAAQGAADQKAARMLAEEAVYAREDLERLGVRFARNPDGGYMGYKACFSSRARSYVVEDHFRPLSDALYAAVQKRGIGVIDGAFVADLIMDDGRCCGALAFLSDQRGLVVRAKTVVIATGGASTLFGRNMYPNDITGDGYAMAYRAGAQMANMEFIQAGIGMTAPTVNILGVQLWEAQPTLLDGEGRALLDRHLPPGISPKEVIAAKGGHFPFSSRDLSRYVEIAVHREINREKAAPGGRVYMDFTGVDFKNLFKNPKSRLATMWPITYERFCSMGIDLYRDKIEIACFAHAINGGILTDENGQSSLPGLYAAGESAAGPHGADRLGGNMSVACQVFGRRAGVAAAERAAKTRTCPGDKISLCEMKRRYRAYAVAKGTAKEIKKLLQQAADTDLLIVRNERGLRHFLHTLSELQQNLRQSHDGDLLSGLELRNLLTCGRLIACAALDRTESRGSHYRGDYTNPEPAMSRMLIQQNGTEL